MSWLHHIHDFETYLRLERNLSSNSVEAYIRDVEHLMRYAEPLGIAPESVTPDHLKDCLKQFSMNFSQTPTDSQLSTLNSQLSIASQRRLIAGWRSFFHLLVIEEVIDESPADFLTLPSRGKHLPDVLTDQDVAALQATFDRSLPGPDRNYVIVEVLYGCGLRVSELVNLKLSNIFAEDEMLQIFGKGNKERWVPINTRALRMLLDYIQYNRSQLPIQKGEEKYVFLNLRGHHLSRVAVFQFIQEAAEKAGIRKHVSPHSLRHTFATELVQNGADLRAVQEMLGHESLSTTEIYTHLTHQYLRETIHTYHPHYKVSND